MINPNIQKIKRHFVAENLSINNWEDLLPYFDLLQKREIATLDDLKKWLKDWSELEAVVSEDACWRQIKMTCDTQDPKLEAAFTYFVTEIEPHIKPFNFSLNKKLDECSLKDQLDMDSYFPLLRQVANQLSIYREENISLQSQESLLAQKYGSISAAMSIEHEGQELTLQQAAKLLQSSDQKLRATIFEKVNERRLKDQDELDDLFNQLIKIRHQIAWNAGFENYRDYKFKALGRFDYTPEDCFAFHEAIKKYMVPLQKELLLHKQKELGLSSLKPYDTVATPEGQKPLKPFESGAELLAKSIQVLQNIKPEYGACLQTMAAMGHLDLESRKGKAPGGYNCPLAESGVPFIFMNAAGTLSDVITMMHEAGHALHSFAAHELPLTAMKEYPMEMAELASMSMELFSMGYWEHFFKNPEELRRAQWEELERVIDVLPWIAIIDQFQHWIYTHPEHSIAERRAKWIEIHQQFSTGVVDWNGYHHYQENLWQKQLHLYEVPFYYIEYGIAQLGAIAMWRQFLQQPQQALANYETALSAGNTRTLPQLYQLAGIAFNFSEAYVKELADFVAEQMKNYTTA